VTPIGAEGTSPGVSDKLEGTEGPTAFVATTVNVYAWPLVKPVIVAVFTSAETLTNNPPGLDVTLYPVIGDPPLLGAVQEIVTCWIPATPVTPVGAEGTVAGVAEILEGTEDPMAFIATTVNVYDWPLVKPVIVAVRSKTSNTPRLEVTLYPVIGEPPSLGAVQERVTCWFPPIAVTPVGAEGTVPGVTETLDGTEAPTALFATTVNVYNWPFVKPVIVAVTPLTSTNSPVLEVTL
jgi:hypothetical protein